ncbi:MAG: hypothetical protein QQW96_00355 [Tychonema bourrellyi B0820]|uniref:hypothetical protein n=1 Tax=Tychonema bourrellyi TaxID=54313 RepID=UPI00117E05AD|nr:hypothetical protein [Tychonema bourrellyi]MDQ2096091.1 hypothetical protein [Tychonema bourrellyi B0820]
MNLHESDRAYPLYTNRWADGTICTAQAWTVAEVLRAWLLVLLRAFHGGPAPVMDERNSFSPSPLSSSPLRVS